MATTKRGVVKKLTLERLRSQLGSIRELFKTRSLSLLHAT
jgi:hypothetical protein